MPSVAELNPPSTSPAHCKTAVLNTRAQVVHSLDHKPFTSHHEFAEGQHRKRRVPALEHRRSRSLRCVNSKFDRRIFLMAFSQQSTATIHFCSKCSWSQQFTADIFPSRATAELKDPLDSEDFTNFNCSYWSLSTTWYYVLARCFMRL